MSENRKPPDWGAEPPEEDLPSEEPPEPEPEDGLAELRSRRARRELEKALDDIDEDEDDPAAQMEEGFDQYLGGELDKSVACWLAAAEGNPGIIARILSWDDPGVLRRLDARKLKEAWACADEDWWAFYVADFDVWFQLFTFWCRPAVQRTAGAEAFGVLMTWRGGPPEPESLAKEVQNDLEGDGPEWDVRSELGWSLYRIGGFFADLDKEGRRPEDLPEGLLAELRLHQAAMQKRALVIARDGLTEDVAFEEIEGLQEKGLIILQLIEDLRAALPPLPPRVVPESASLDGLCPCGSGRNFRECCGRRGE
ncbi:MAG: SEC-C domain-containing protein [Planctomycetota bacterium]